MLAILLSTCLMLAPTSGITTTTITQCIESLQIAEEQLQAKERKEEYIKAQVAILANKTLDELQTSFYGYEGILFDRRDVVNTAISLENKIPYEWGGKAQKSGWDDLWNTRKNDAGELYGLDCSGFVSWAYKTALDLDIGQSTAEQSRLKTISYEELKPGDLGLMYEGGSDSQNTNHVGIYVGKDENGRDLWCDCNADDNTVVVRNAKYFKVYKSLL